MGRRRGNHTARDVLVADREMRRREAPAQTDRLQHSIAVGRFVMPRSTYTKVPNNSLADFVRNMDGIEENDTIGRTVNPYDMILKIVKPETFDEIMTGLFAQRRLTNKSARSANRNVTAIKKDIDAALKEQGEIECSMQNENLEGISRERLQMDEDDVIFDVELSKTDRSPGIIELPLRKRLFMSDNGAMSVAVLAYEGEEREQVLQDLDRVNEVFNSLNLFTREKPRILLNEVDLEIDFFTLNNPTIEKGEEPYVPLIPLSSTFQPLGIHKLT